MVFYLDWAKHFIAFDVNMMSVCVANAYISTNSGMTLHLNLLATDNCAIKVGVAMSDNEMSILEDFDVAAITDTAVFVDSHRGILIEEQTRFES